MVTSDPDPTERWRAIVEFYTDFAAKRHWEFLAPMVGLAEWVAAQPMAARLYPGTSHEWLTVGLHPGYQPELPFFASCSGGDGLFRCELYGAVGRQLHTWAGPLDQAPAAFTEFVGRLEAVAPNHPLQQTGGA
jgi:hypothetical protein